MALLTVLSGALVVSGVAFWWYGLRPLAVLPRLLRAPVLAPEELPGKTTEASDEEPDDGSFVVCRGTARSAEETLTAPFSGRDCLGLEYEVTEKQLLAGIPWEWIPIDDAVAAVPFRLEGSDDVRVEPESRQYALDVPADVTAVGAGDHPPDRVQAFLAVREQLKPGPTTRVGSLLGAGLSPLGIGDRRYAEHRLDPGEEYLVAGRATRTEDTLTIGGPLVISDRGPRGTAIRRLRSAAGPLLFGLAFVLAGIGLLVLG